MLRIEVDVFSGRPNPTWIVTDPAESDRLIGAARERRAGVTRIGQGLDTLGLREVRVRLLGDDDRRNGVPREFAVASTAAEDHRASIALAQLVVDTMERRNRDVQLVEHALTPLTPQLLDLIRDLLARRPIDNPSLPRPGFPPRNPLRTTVHDTSCEKCEYEVSQFNPGFWNTPTVQPHNNCYNYARDWRTDTFAQPGRAHGAQAQQMACNNVTNAALADGLVHRCDCLPDSEYPRRHVALVIWPGVDYHWYREQRGGFWGHKPGPTAARNYDNSNAIIVNPETADRGDYTDFCGHFYAGRSVVIT